jgi:hypothetical protein
VAEGGLRELERISMVYGEALPPEVLRALLQALAGLDRFCDQVQA